MSQSEDTPRLEALDHLVLTVADIATTCAFYARVLGMTAEQFTPSGGPTRWALKINLHQAGNEFAPKAARPGPGTADLCFLTETPLPAWQSHLSASGVEIEEGPVPRTGATGPILSLYIRDPDGNLIEISTPA